MYHLDISLDEVARYLGFGETPMDEKTLEDVHWAREELRRVATPRHIQAVFPLSQEKPPTLVGAALTLAGQDIQSLLKDCTQCLLLAVTLGQGVDALIRRLQITDLSRSVIVDVCASSMVEHLCDQINDSLTQQWRHREKFLTDRFAPGYGDLPLALQHSLCDVLDAQKKIGLTVTSAGILIPRKSITAVIGIADTKQKLRIRGCAHCPFAPDCSYRKGGTSCAS